MPKVNPRSKITEKIAQLVMEVTKQSFEVKAELTPENEGAVMWKKKK